MLKVTKTNSEIATFQFRFALLYVRSTVNRIARSRAARALTCSCSCWETQTPLKCCSLLLVTVQSDPLAYIPVLSFTAPWTAIKECPCIHLEFFPILDHIWASRGGRPGRSIYGAPDPDHRRAGAGPCKASPRLWPASRHTHPIYALYECTYEVRRRFCLTKGMTEGHIPE